MTTTSIATSVPVLDRARKLTQMPLGLLLCFALLSNFFETTGHDRQRLLEVAVLAVVALAALVRSTATGPVFLSQGGRPLAAFFLLGLLSTAQAYSPAHAAFEVSMFFLLYVFALQVAREIERGGAAVLLRLVQLVAVICALHSLKFWVVYAGSFIKSIPLDIEDFTIGFSNIRFFNHTQTAILPLLLLLCCITPRQSRLRWLWWSLASYWWMAIFATSGRGTLVGMVGGGIAVALLRRGQSIPYLKAAVLSAALGLMAYVLFMVAIPTLAGGSSFGAFASVVERTAADPTSSRLVLWRRACELILQHPWVGVGPMHFAHNAGDLHTGAHPHDWIMQIASEWGVPAFLFLCAALFCAGRALLRAGRGLAPHDRVDQLICSALVAGGATILIDGLVSGLFVMPQSQLAVTLYLGCAIGWCRARVRMAGVVAKTVHWRRVGVGILISVAAACVVALVWPDMGARYHGQPMGAAIEALNTGVNWPRLWHAGYF